MSSSKYLLIILDSILNNCNASYLRLDSDISVEEGANREFVVSHEFIIFDLKKLAYSFGLKWNFCTTRYGRRITFHRAHR